MSDDLYNLTPAEAVTHLQAQLRKMKAEANRKQLKGIKPDDAFEMGYAAAIFDLTHYTGPSPVEEYGDAVARLAEAEKENPSA